MLDLKGQLFPIEVKGGVNLGKGDLYGILEFCQKFKMNSALVLYSGLKREEKTDGIRIKYFPVWDFLSEPFDNFRLVWVK